MSSPRWDTALSHATFGSRIADLMSRTPTRRRSNEGPASSATLQRVSNHADKVSTSPASGAWAHSPPTTSPVIHNSNCRIHSLTPKRVLKVPSSKPIIGLRSPQSDAPSTPAASPPLVQSEELRSTAAPLRAPAPPPPFLITVDVRGIAFTDLDAALSSSATLLGGIRLQSMLNKDLLIRALTCDWDAMLMCANLSFALAENCRRADAFPRRCDDGGFDSWAARIAFHFQAPPTNALRSAVVQVITTCLADRASTGRPLCFDGDALLKAFANGAGMECDPTVCAVCVDDYVVQQARAISSVPRQRSAERGTQTEVAITPPSAATHKPVGHTVTLSRTETKRHYSGDDLDDDDEIRTPTIVRHHQVSKHLFTSSALDGPSAESATVSIRTQHPLSQSDTHRGATLSPRRGTVARSAPGVSSQSVPYDKRRLDSNNNSSRRQSWHDDIADESHAVYIVGSATYNPLDIDVMVPVSLLVPGGGGGPLKAAFLRNQVFGDAGLALLNRYCCEDAVSFVNACAGSLSPPHEISVKHVVLVPTWEVLCGEADAASPTDVVVTLRHTFLLNSPVDDAIATVSAAILRRDANILRQSFRRSLQQLMLTLCAASVSGSDECWSVREIPGSLAGCGTRLNGNVLMPLPTRKPITLPLLTIVEPVEQSNCGGASPRGDDRLAASGSWGEVSPRKHAPPHPLETHRGLPRTAQPQSRTTVSLRLVFPHLAWAPLSESLLWWDSRAREHRVTEPSATTRPTEQLLRAILFDILDAMQEFCCEPDDCVVRFVMPQMSPEEFGFSTPQHVVSQPAPSSGVFEVAVEISLPGGDVEPVALRRAALDMCMRPACFGALLDVYTQLCTSAPAAEEVTISTTIDRDESTIDGVALSSHLTHKDVLV